MASKKRGDSADSKPIFRILWLPALILAVALVAYYSRKFIIESGVGERAGIPVLSVAFVILSILLILHLWERYELLPKINLNLPYASLAVSSGILFTFLGIALGLQDFNTASPATFAKSVQTLIDGLKTAFWSTVAGLAVALIVRITQRKPTDEFGKELASGLSKPLQALVKTLQETIAEELGQAFQELRVSIQELNRWMQEHRERMNETAEHLEANMRALREARIAIEKTGEAVKPIAQITGQLEQNLIQLGATLSGVEKAQENIREIAVALQQMIHSSKEELPDLRTRLDETKEIIDEALGDIRRSVASVKEATDSASKGVREAIDEAADGLKEATREALGDVQQSVANTRKAAEKMPGIIKEVADTALNHFNQSVASMKDASDVASKSVEQTTSAALDDVKKSVASVKEATDSIPGIARAQLNQFSATLAEISKQFAKDYRPLAERLAALLSQLENNGKDSAGKESEDTKEKEVV